ncbi:MaoC/PaaZ C-terminal domain-containing protein [Amycolatopsis sp. cg5]|uniref:MaoC/PaaZ C-terminal domain-containing protein n=1 Tax=Amycolatopsis sp. cg5 TaxID=3238802 RepID=UPI003526014F
MTASFRLSRADLVRYAGASGDFNALHWSDEAAAAAGLGGVVAHGMLLAGLAMTLAGECRASSVKFLKPVVVPETGDVVITVDSAEKPDGAELTVRCAGELVARVNVRG